MNYLKTLTLNKEFKRAYYQGKSKAHPLVITYLLKNRRNGARYGVTASKKIGNAVLRNRARRVITAALSQIENERNLRGFDMVFVARSATCKAKSTDLKKVISKHLDLLGL
ncbi:MAG: ribonuclease P protein component [Oscillospiraceae bacterium]|nr:ribonuclease P protein component [Oscillospiraceae bacterium]